MIWNCLFVGIGGFFGSIARYLIGLIPIREGGVFPINTLLINVAGALLIGIIAAMALKNQEMDPHLILLLKVGVCGGFTTFSTFSLETVGLLESGNYLTALLYVIASVVLCVAVTLLAEIMIK